MVRAILVKLGMAVLVGLEIGWLPDGALRTACVVATIGATVAFFALVIVSPRAQFLVPSVYELPEEAATERAIAFTFDDGPDPETTPRILDLLARHGACATFFVVGQRAADHPDLVRRILAEGHAVGSHTYRHSHAFHFSSARRMRAEVLRGIDAVQAITGSAPRLFRPPQGLRTPLLRDALEPLDDLVCVTWTARGLDAMGRPASSIVRRLESALRPGAIVALHDGGGLGGTTSRGPTVEALERLLELARDRGLRCVSLAGVAKAG